MLRAAVAALVVVLLAGGVRAWRSPAPQLPQVPGAFRSAITLVPLDVRVLDRDGRAVTDLEERDFTILEDNVPQVIAHFEKVVLTAAADAAPAPTEPIAFRKPTSFDIAAQRRRIFLIMLGRGRLREPSKALTGLTHFVRDRLLPQDQVALVAWNRATDFTTDHEKIAQAIERFDRAHEDIEARLAHHFSSLTAAYGSKELPRAIQGDIDAVFGGRQLMPAGIPDSQRLEDDRRRTMGDLWGWGAVASDMELEDFIAENARTMQDLGNLYAAIEYMRFLEGEKHLILVTEKGLMLPREEDDKNIAEIANSARVVIDTIETGGLYVGQSVSATRGGPNPGQWSQWWAFQALKNVAELTGGRSSITEYTRVAVDRIDDSTRAGYLLGYYPKNLKWDGRYRKVTVKVARRGLTVLYRHGYDASDQIVPFARQEFLTFNRIISAALYPEDVRDIGVRAKASVVRAAAAPALSERSDKRVEGREIAVEVKIDAARISFAAGTDENEGRHVARLEAVAFAIDSKGRATDERWQAIDLALKDDEYERVRRGAIPYSVRLPWKAATREVKVIVYDYAADLLGSTTAKVF